LLTINYYLILDSTTEEQLQNIINSQSIIKSPNPWY